MLAGNHNCEDWTEWLDMDLTEEDRDDSIHDDDDDEEAARQPGKSSKIVNLGDEEVMMGVSSMAVKLPAEETSKYLLRITHLHCQGKMINMIADLRSVRNLTVLYLYNNKIKVIDCMSHVPNLKLLYLQNNIIEVMAGLEDLTKLGNLNITYLRIILTNGSG